MARAIAGDQTNVPIFARPMHKTICMEPPKPKYKIETPARNRTKRHARRVFQSPRCRWFKSRGVHRFSLNPSPDDVGCNVFSRGPVSPHLQILFGWIIRSIFAWMCRQDALWYTKLALLFILRNVLLSLDIFSTVKEQLKVGVKAGVKLGVSLITQVLCCFIDIADGLATRGADYLSDFVIDPISPSIDCIPEEPNQTHDHNPKGSGIPGRHNGRRARNKGRGARVPPTRKSCVRRYKCKDDSTPTSGDCYPQHLFIDRSQDSSLPPTWGIIIFLLSADARIN